MEQSVLEQVTPIVAGGAISGLVGLLALILGRRLERRDTRTAWIREQRLDAYTTMLDTANGIWTSVALYSIAVHNGTATSDDQDAVMGHAERLTMIKSRIRLLGPEAVTRASDDLTDALVMFMGQAESGELIAEGGLPTTEMGKAVRAAEARFTEVAADCLD